MLYLLAYRYKASILLINMLSELSKYENKYRLRVITFMSCHVSAES